MPAGQINSADLDNFLDTTFRVVSQSGASNQPSITLNREMVRLLVSLDGKSTMKTIARQMNITGEQAYNYMNVLSDHGLVEILPNKATILDDDFFKALSAALARIVGPIAPIVIDDAIESLGYQRSGFPVKRVAELINSLAIEIKQKDKRLAFQKYMIELLKKKRYLRL